MITILMSIKADHNANIEAGRKLVELRKRIPRFDPPIRVLTYESGKNGRHMVTNEWTCRNITCMFPVNDGEFIFYKDIVDMACVEMEQANRYGNGGVLFGMHISDLVIYDKPKKLSDFIIPSKFGCVNEGKCRDCVYFYRGNGFNVEYDCGALFCTDEYKPLRRPPRSWCYVEEATR